MLPLALGHEDVGGERERGAERGGDADGAERDPAPELDDDRQPGDAEDERGPDPPPDVLVVDEAREERDEERAEELDEERDPDRQMVDRDEVQELHEPDSGDAEDDEEEELAPVGAERRAREEEQEDEEPDRGARRADLGQLERREAGAEHDLRDGSVHGEEARGHDDHRVSEPRAVVDASLVRGEEGRVDHPEQAIQSRTRA